MTFEADPAEPVAGAGTATGAGASTAARTRLASLGLTAVGAVLALVTAGQAWWRLTGPDVANLKATMTGTTVTSGLAQALPLCGLAAGLLSLALRVWGRRIVGGLIAAAGIGIAVLGGLHPPPSQTAVQQTLQQVSLGGTAGGAPTIGVWIYLAAGLLLAAGGLIMVGRAHRWPSRARRYEKRAPDPEDWWKVMDAGTDPTAEPVLATPAPTARPTARPTPAAPIDPVSSSGGASATMGRQAPGHPSTRPRSSSHPSEDP